MLQTGLLITLATCTAAAAGPEAKRQAESNAFHHKMVAQANEADAKARPRAEKDPTRPTYHFQAPARWMNDPNGPIFYQGAYHLFYQHNPYGEDWGHMHWGHARSKDLIHWLHLPIALAPSTDRGEEHCFSGCAVVNHGVPTIFYTSIGPSTPSGDGAVQWMATSRDGMRTWDKYPGNPVLSGRLHKGLNVKEWRDPFAWQEGDTWYMVLGGHREGGHGCAFLYRSANLTDWRFLHVLYEGKEDNWECPSFFKLGDRWVLVYSPHGVVKYYTGTLDRGHRFHPERHGSIDLSTTYYAPNSLADGKGRRIMWGWVRVKGEGWNGMLSLPRVLTMRRDGRLGMTAAPELQALRGEHHRVAHRTVKADSPYILTEVHGDCLEVRVEFEPGDATSFGLMRQTPDGKNVPLASFGRTRKELRAGSASGGFELLEVEKTLRLDIFLDRSVMEVYANGRQCVTSPLTLGSVDCLGFFAHKGSAKIKSADVWWMKPAKESRGKTG